MQRDFFPPSSLLSVDRIDTFFTTNSFSRFFLSVFLCHFYDTMWAVGMLNPSDSRAKRSEEKGFRVSFSYVVNGKSSFFSLPFRSVFPCFMSRSRIEAPEFGIQIFCCVYHLEKKITILCARYVTYWVLHYCAFMGYKVSNTKISLFFFFPSSSHCVLDFDQLFFLFL